VSSCEDGGRDARTWVALGTPFSVAVGRREAFGTGVDVAAVPTYAASAAKVPCPIPNHSIPAKAITKSAAARETRRRAVLKLVGSTFESFIVAPSLIVGPATSSNSRAIRRALGTSLVMVISR
jgi:hypothetical protein